MSEDTSPAVRSNPASPFNATEAKIIAERQAIVRSSIYERIKDPGNHPWFMLYPRALARELDIARAAMQGEGLYCLRRKAYREITGALAIPPVTYANHHDGAERTGFVVATPGQPWQFNVSTLIDLAAPSAITDKAVLAWLGWDVQHHSYAGHHDPFYVGPDLAERVGDVAVRWDSTDVSGWEAEDASRWTTTTTWYSAMIGAAWWLAADDSRTLTVGGKALTHEASVAWVLESVEAWPDARQHFLANSLGVFTRLQSRQLCRVNTGGQVDGFATAVDATQWTDWRFTQLPLAVAEGRSFT